MKSPNIRKHTIVVVGFDDNCTEDDLVDTLVDQNYFLKAFFATNKVNDHLKLLDIKPLRRDPELFQAILKVSKQLRLLLERKNDRLIVGITSCKVYDRLDRQFVKRCAHCQRYGHFQDAL